MLKLMLFIDGSWAYSSVPRLGERYNKEDFHIDFGKLPGVLGKEVGGQLGTSDVDIVRTCLFGSYASNYDARDEELVQKRLDFYAMLKEEFHYEVDIYQVNFMGRRIRYRDRDPGDDFVPAEKCVDIALASSMLYYAALPNVFDVAVAVLGDRDFVPLLHTVRRLGKRVAIASIRGCCSFEYSDPEDRARVRDTDMIWLDDLLNRIELRYEPRLMRCESPLHRGEPEVWDTYRPRKGQRYYCPACRQRFAEQREDAAKEWGSAASNVVVAEAPRESALPQGLTGSIKYIKWDKGYGFIEAADGLDYFFHFSDLNAELEWDDLYEGLEVEFDLKKAPSPDRAGAGTRVRPIVRAKEEQNGDAQSSPNHSAH